MQVRAEFLTSFAGALTPVGLLDPFKVDGVVASWWNEIQFDLKTLSAQGFDGLVDGWVATVRAVFEDDEKVKSKRLDDASERFVARLLPSYAQELSDFEDRKTVIEAKLASTKTDDESGDGDDTDDEVSSDEMKILKKQLATAKKELKALRSDLVNRLDDARSELSPEHVARLALDIFEERLVNQLVSYTSAHRALVVDCACRWWDKYHTTLAKITESHAASTAELERQVKVLGYVD
jgi:type I restriction enzyme M protein